MKKDGQQNAPLIIRRLSISTNRVLKIIPWLLTVILVAAVALAAWSTERRRASLNNGGFRYFFENDFPNHPPYSDFSDDYREIGVTDVADWIDAAAALFGFPDPAP